MDGAAIIRQRRSIRAFRPDPVPEALLRAVLEQAAWAPSWANTQDWMVYVVQGDALQRLRAETERDADLPLPSPEVPMPDRDFPDELIARSMFAPARGLRRVAGAVRRRISPPPPHPRSDLLYGAPCVVILAIPDGRYGEYAALDAGLFVQTACLAAEARGLGTCILAQVVRRPEPVRRVLPDLAGQRLLVGVALGYPDQEAEANRTPRNRVAVDELVTWVME